MIRRLHAILAELARRRQQQRLHGGLAVTWWLGIFVAVLLWRYGAPVRTLAATLLPLLAAASIAVWWWSRSGLGNPREIAKLVETKHPELRTALLAALDQRPEGGTFNYLQLRLLVESVAVAERDEWLELVPQPRLKGLRTLNLIGIALLALMLAPALKPDHGHATASSPDAKATTTSPLDVSVEPGDIEIERGTPLTVQARFAANIPAEASLETTDESGQVSSIPMTRPFTEPVFQARLSAVPGPLEYRIVTPGGSSRSFKVRVFDLPALVSSQAVLTFPEHLGKQSETIKDPRSIQVPERTAIALSFTANLPGLSATLNAKDKEPLKLVADAADSPRYVVEITPKESIRYELVLTDSAGRRNSRKDLLDIKVLPNKAPIVKVVLPRKNDKATPIQEVRLEAKITDDTGLLAQGIRYTLDGEKWHELETPIAAGAKLPDLSQLIDLEAAGAKPKDILMWNAWAEDMGPDGKKRRVNGDIHIVRVRDFDEAFFEQAAPPGGEQEQQAGAEGEQGGATDLIKTETQILNATWGIRRDHAEIRDTPPDSEELETLRRSQEIAIETATALEAEQTNPSVRQHLTDARLAMKEALVELTNAKEKTSAAPLEDAISHEQVALRHLYQLMSSETTIMTGQNAGQQSSSSEEMEREELELERKETPYQAEKQARPETPAGEAAQAMDTLRRLEELAKRQRDLNEEIQALQNALAEANTPEKRAEVERQLKQLREQQRELLADVDQLREQTNDPSRDAAQQPRSEALDEARERAQQANEQLSENKLGEALAAGRRAQEALQKEHDDFRQNSAAQLAEELRDLRQDARALEERQQQLADSGEQNEASRAPRLRESDAITPGIAQQRENLQKLMDNVRETAQSAERAEPLVSKDLSEALRGAEQNQIARSLEQMEQSGSKSPAAERATEGIADLTREIEGAAERVLGDEAQTLRYARDQLKELSEQAAGEAPPSPGEGQPDEQAGNTPEQGNQPGQQPDEGQPGEQAGNQPGQSNQPGQQPGQGRPGEQAGNQPGQRNQPGQQPGQGQPGEQAGAQPGQRNQPGQQPGEGQPGEQAGNQPGQSNQPGQQPGQGNRPNRGGASGGGNGRGGSRNSPVTGNDFQEWNERLGDLETLLEDPEAQAAVARARQASREMRRDFTRHSVEPGQEQLDKEIVRPLAEAAHKIDERLRELDRKDPLAPVGRDPVPERYDDLVRRYFEELGK